MTSLSSTAATSTPRILVAMGYLGPDVTTQERVARGSKLGMFYQSVADCLLHRGKFKNGQHEAALCQKWRRLKKLHSTRFPDLILGGACGHGIPYRRLSASSVRSSKPPTLVNYYRGFEVLCRKTRMVETLRACFSETELLAWLPESYLFFPARPDASEAKAFTEAHDRVRAEIGRSLWICKPSDGSKGRAIFITENKEEVLQAMRSLPVLDEEKGDGGCMSKDDEEKKGGLVTKGAVRAAIGGDREKWRTRHASTGNVAWVVQRYIEYPMLLKGRRKFDIRMWVLVDSDFRVYMHESGVLRTTSLPFTTDADKLGDDFVHLSNHSIQEHCEAYGKYEATNEMFFDEFGKWLAEEYLVKVDETQHDAEDVNWWTARTNPEAVRRECGKTERHGWYPASVERDIMPQMRRIAALTLHAARPLMQGAPGASFGSFHLFGYDFMVDDSLCVKLLEINSSPAVAEALLAQMTRDVVQTGIIPFFEGSQNAASTSGFREISCSRWLATLL